MPDLSQSLQGCDLGHLRIVAELWGVELDAPEASDALPGLCSALLDSQLVSEIIAALPEDARMAVEDLVQNHGRLPWPLFTRRYGTVREMGAGRRDRDRPYRQPVSPAEMLWYRALVARAFFDTPNGLVEFAYIPDDLLPLIPVSGGGASSGRTVQPLGLQPLGRPATAAERAYSIQATDRILDHACTLLAALRMGMSSEAIASLASFWNTTPAPISPNPLSPVPLVSLLSTAALLDASGMPQPEPTRTFLEAGRGEALAQLAQAWLHSTDFNDLRLIPHLKCEGEWENDPLVARQALLGFLSTVPTGAWWSLPAFVAAIRREAPDFQRPAGDYDSWFVRDKGTGEFLRGFERWDEVDGALIRYIITGPLYWLGILDLASPAPPHPSSEGFPVGAFRLSGWGKVLLDGLAPVGLAAEDEVMTVGSDARLRVPRLAARAMRYQVARFCEWQGEKDDVYRYQITPGSLERARQASLTLGQLLTLLRHQARAVPPSLAKALERWEQHGTQVHLERALVLRLASPEMLQRLRKSRAARFLGDPLGPATVIVKPGAGEKVLLILAELGYLGEGERDE